MSPEKEKRLLEAARTFEVASHKAAALREKHDKLRQAQIDVQKQLDAAAKECQRAEEALHAVVVEDVPHRPGGYGGQLQVTVSPAALRDALERPGQLLRIGDPVIPSDAYVDILQTQPTKGLAQFGRGLKGPMG